MKCLFAKHTLDSLTNYASFLTGLWWDAYFGPNLWQTRSRQHDPKCRLKSSQYTLIIPQCHRVIQLTTMSFWVPETRLRLPQVNKYLKNPSKASEVPSDTIIHFYIYFFLIHRGALCSQPIRDKVHQTGRIFPEHVEWSFLDPEYNFVAVQWILQTIFIKQKFTQ